MKCLQRILYTIHTILVYDRNCSKSTESSPSAPFHRCGYRSILSSIDERKHRVSWFVWSSACSLGRDNVARPLIAECVAWLPTDRETSPN